MAKTVAKPEKAKKRAFKSENDIYTALLGLATLVLAATAVFACMRSMEIYGQIINW